MHVQNGYLSTSRLKYDVTVMFLHPSFIKDVKVSTILVHLRHSVINISVNFQDLLTSNRGLGAK